MPPLGFTLLVVPVGWLALTPLEAPVSHLELARFSATFLEALSTTMLWAGESSSTVGAALYQRPYAAHSSKSLASAGRYPSLLSGLLGVASRSCDFECRLMSL